MISFIILMDREVSRHSNKFWKSKTRLYWRRPLRHNIMLINPHVRTPPHRYPHFFNVQTQLLVLCWFTGGRGTIGLLSVRPSDRPSFRPLVIPSVHFPCPDHFSVIYWGNLPHMFPLVRRNVAYMNHDHISNVNVTHTFSRTKCWQNSFVQTIFQ